MRSRTFSWSESASEGGAWNSFCGSGSVAARRGGRTLAGTSSVTVVMASNGSGQVGKSGVDGERRIAGLCGGGDADLLGGMGTMIGGGIIRLLLGERSTAPSPSSLK